MKGMVYIVERQQLVNGEWKSLQVVKTYSSRRDAAIHCKNWNEGNGDEKNRLHFVEQEVELDEKGNVASPYGK